MKIAAEVEEAAKAQDLYLKAAMNHDDLGVARGTKGRRFRGSHNERLKAASRRFRRIQQ